VLKGAHFGALHAPVPVVIPGDTCGEMHYDAHDGADDFDMDFDFGF